MNSPAEVCKQLFIKRIHLAVICYIYFIFQVSRRNWPLKIQEFLACKY